MPVLKLDAAPVVPEVYHLPAEKLIAGNPRQEIRMQYADPSNRFFVGEWCSEPGTWHVTYTEEEYCRMLEGTSIITDAQGQAVTVGAGDAFVVPRGFVGTWQVVETTRKSFVVYEPGAEAA